MVRKGSNITENLPAEALVCFFSFTNFIDTSGEARDSSEDRVRCFRAGREWLLTFFPLLLRFVDFDLERDFDAERPRVRPFRPPFITEGDL